MTAARPNKFKTGLLAAALFAAQALLFPLIPAQAAMTVLCAAQLPDTAAARTIGGTTSQIPSGTIYTLNGQGCTIAKQADIGWFMAQGFSPGPPFGANVLFTTGVLTGTTAVQIGTLPPSAYVQHIIVNNLTANAIGTTGIAFGTTANGTDIDAALACGANCLVFAADSALAKRVFSTTAATPVFASATSNWNSANVTITVVYGYF
jgi:hypothetical protein